MASAVASGLFQYPFITFSPRMTISPTSPGATSVSSGPQSWNSTPRIGIPTEPGLTGRSGWLKEAIGEVSDNPYPSSSWKPKRRCTS